LYATSGTPRESDGNGVLPGGVFCQVGRPKIELNPPPESIQPISMLFWFLHVEGGSVLSSTRDVVLFGS
jgi:hypothetical protein